MKKGVFVVIPMVWLACESVTLEGPVDCDENPVMLELISAQAANCTQNNGSIEVAASGGNGKYSFSIGSGAKQAASVFNDLTAGEYEIIAVDGNNCTNKLLVMVASESGLEMTVDVNAAGCKTSNGMVTVSGVNGTAPYQYKLGQGSFGSTNAFSALAAGEYPVVVKDAAGCEVTQNARVTSGVSYSASIKEIIETKCAISGCHNGTQFPDFRVFKNIQDNAARVKTLTGDGSMPLNSTLTQEQINLIACWVDDGAQDN